MHAEHADASMRLMDLIDGRFADIGPWAEPRSGGDPRALVHLLISPLD
jgi:hypothetical protein